jgi:SOS response regulatory protein OraA/RecX
MQSDDLQPPPVPPCSTELVATLKLRLYEAIASGKPADAKTLLDIIERLAKLQWLDDLDTTARMAANKAHRDQLERALHEKLQAFVDSEPQNQDL